MYVRLSSAGVRELELSRAIEDLLVPRVTRSLGKATSTAPVVSGAYRASLRVVVERSDRVRVRLISTVPYAMKVEAKYGTLATALDAAGGA